MSTTCGGLTLPDPDDLITSSSISTNFIGVLSNQQGSGAPSPPILGQNWFDTSVPPGTLRVWNGSSWATVGGGGATGATGVTGVIGATGTGGVGATGATGASGSAGSAGTGGTAGTIGITGATGSSVAGTNGAQGSTGVTGVSGATGSTGATGAAGTPSLIILDTWASTNPTTYNQNVTLSGGVAANQWVNVPFTGSGVINNIGATFSTQTQTFGAVNWGPWPTYTLPAGTYYVNARVFLGMNLSSGAAAILALCDATTGARLLFGANARYGGSTTWDIPVDGVFTIASSTALVFRVNIPSSLSFNSIYFRKSGYVSWAGEPNYSGVFSNAQFYKLS